MPLTQLGVGDFHGVWGQLVLLILCPQSMSGANVTAGVTLLPQGLSQLQGGGTPLPLGPHTPSATDPPGHSRPLQLVLGICLKQVLL